MLSLFNFYIRLFSYPAYPAYPAYLAYPANPAYPTYPAHLYFNVLLKNSSNADSLNSVASIFP